MLGLRLKDGYYVKFTVGQNDRQVKLFPKSDFYFSVVRYTLADTIFDI